MQMMVRLNAWVGGLEGWRRRGFAAFVGAISGLGFAPYGPAVDGATFSESPGQLLADGAGVDVPLMVGSNLNEMTVFLLGAPRPESAEEMRAQFLSAVGDDEGAADTLMELYDVTTTEDAERAFEAFATDRSFACDALSIAETAAAAGREVYLRTWRPGKPCSAAKWAESWR